MLSIDVIAGASGTRHDGLLLVAEGLRAHSVSCRTIGFEAQPAAPVIACWGWSRAKRHVSAGGHALVMERGHVGDPSWRTLGWDGTGGRARYACRNDGGARWRRHFAHCMKPWRRRDDGYALVLGQLQTSPAVIEAGIDYGVWARLLCDQLRELGLRVRFRPHPREHTRACYGAELAEGALGEALEGATFAVTLNSGAATDAVLGGVPTLVFDRGAIAWEVASHALPLQRDYRPLATPDRSAWAARLAWTQWEPQELERGAFWPHLAAVMEPADG